MGAVALSLDKVLIERLWRSLKYELVYFGDFASGADLYLALDRYFRFYNHRRPHQALDYRTPADLYPHPLPATMGSANLPTGQPGDRTDVDECGKHWGGRINHGPKRARKRHRPFGYGLRSGFRQNAPPL